MNIKFGFLWLFCFFILLGCVNNFESVNYSNISTKSNYGTDIEMNYYFKGLLEFKLIAPSVEQLKETELINIFPDGIKVFIYDFNLDTIATIFSEFALQDEKEKLIEVKQNVILTNFKKEKLSTEQLFWNRDEKKIYTDDFVTINRENEVIMGYGFVSDETFSTYSLSNITGTIYL